MKLGRILRTGGAVVLTAGLAALSVAAVGAARQTGFDQRNLVADQQGFAERVDAHLVNPWGLAAGPFTPFWIADNGTGVSTAYLGNGAGVPPVVAIPGTGSEASAPTGVVYNGTTDFKLDSRHPSLYIFVTEDGTIAGWNPATDATHAITKVDRSAEEAIYKGVAVGRAGSANYVYAADFHNARIDIFDRNFAPATLAGAFSDPNLPAGYAPFNIQNLGGRLFVTYAQQDADAEDEVAGPGKGYVDVFDTNGQLLQRLVSGGRLNAPWGLAIAPRGFGSFGGDLLVGNFGDGWINAYDLYSGQFMGSLQQDDGDPIQIDGLWGLMFGNGTLAGDRNKLYFTAGPGDEEHGLFGFIEQEDNGRGAVYGAGGNGGYGNNTGNSGYSGNSGNTGNSGRHGAGGNGGYGSNTGNGGHGVSSGHGGNGGRGY